ncbi:MAG: NADH-quinone oxidoreductase subunit NuoE [bacterium]
MATRKPAKNQPDSFQWSEENLAWCNEQLKKFPSERQASAVIPFLWRAQKQEGWLSIPAMEVIAQQLAMPYIRVYEVATFYTMFNLEPVGKYFVQLCGTTPCMLRGAETLSDICKRVIGPQNQVTDNGMLSWLEVECLGACCNAPMVQINDYYYEDLTAETFEDILNKLNADQEVPPGTFHPQRHTSDPAGENTSLIDTDLYNGMAGQPIVTLPNSDNAKAE